MPPTALLISLILVSFSVSLNNGSFTGNLAQIIGISVSFLILLVYLIKKPDTDKSDPQPAVEFACIATIVLFALIPGGWWIYNRKIIDYIQIFSSLLLLPTVYLILKKQLSEKFLKLAFVFFLLSAAFLRILMLIGSPHPAIDVFIILREAPLKLLGGINPYNTFYTYVFPTIIPDYYAYWPASFILELPFILIFNDPRILLILADLASALLLFIMGGKNRTSLLLSLTYLFMPLSLGIIEASWLTPLDFLLICLIAFSVYKLKNSLLAGLLLGILTSVQFFFAALFIYLIRVLNWNKKFVFSFILTVSVFTLPYLFLDPASFWKETVEVYFRNPPHPSLLIHTSLNLNTLFFNFTRFDLPSFLVYGLLAAIFLLTLLKKESANNFILRFTLFLFSVFVLGRQGFVNYFYLVSSLIILQLAVSLHPDHYPQIP